ncbi:MAG: ABC transporter ATP-binding protein [Pseudomonadota bacterium]
MSLLHIENMSCAYDKKNVVKNVSFSIDIGQGTCLLGPSGCGKTTILRSIAGFEAITSGQITLRNSVMSTPSKMQPPEARKIGMVFQDYALFPHLTNADNIAFGLMKYTKQEKQQIVHDMLALVELSDVAEKYPHEISGGQQHRIALARAMAPKPDLILLDEPFSNLDANLRKHLNQQVKNILKLNGTAFLMVTHDQEEAFAMADYVGVMERGNLLQWDTPFNLYHKPTSLTVADFIGEGQILDAKVISSNCIDSPLGHICSAMTLAEPTGSTIKFLLRPDDVINIPDSRLKAEVIDKSFKGAVTLYQLKFGDNLSFQALFPSHQDYTIGDSVGFGIKADHLVIFAA